MSLAYLLEISMQFHFAGFLFIYFSFFYCSLLAHFLRSFNLLEPNKFRYSQRSPTPTLQLSFLGPAG